MDHAKHLTVVVRLDDVDLLAAARALLTTDRDGEVDRLRLSQPFERTLQLGAFDAAWRIRQHRLVLGGWGLGHGVHVGLLHRVSGLLLP